MAAHGEAPAQDDSADSYALERRVALKIIKPGMDTKEVVARFEAERQALQVRAAAEAAKALAAVETSAGAPATAPDARSVRYAA